MLATHVSHTITADFFTVQMPENANIGFDQALRNSTNHTGEQRNMSVVGVPVRMQEFGEADGFLEGDMIKIRMDDLPRKADLAGESALLELRPTEGLGEEAAFLYVPNLSLLVLQRNRFAIGTSSFARYFEEKAPVGPPIMLHPVLKPDVTRALTRLAVKKRFEISVAGLRNMQLFRNEGHGLEKMMDLQEQFRSPQLSLVFSMGHAKGTALDSRAVLDAVRRLLRISSTDEGGQCVTTLKITGQEQDHEPEVLDLLEYRLTAKRDVDPTERNIAYQTRRTALRAMFAAHRNELETMFRAPGGRHGANT